MKFNNQWNLIFFLFAYIYTYTHAYQGRPHVISLVGEGGGYVTLGPFILDNIRTLVKALQKTK